jgi:hypothetical protein
MSQASPEQTTGPADGLSNSLMFNTYTHLNCHNLSARPLSSADFGVTPYEHIHIPQHPSWVYPQDTFLLCQSTIIRVGHLHRHYHHHYTE